MNTIASPTAARFRSIASRSSAGRRLATSSQAIATPDREAPTIRPSVIIVCADEWARALFGEGGMGFLAVKRLWPRDLGLYRRTESAFVARLINGSHSIEITPPRYNGHITERRYKQELTIQLLPGRLGLLTSIDVIARQIRFGVDRPGQLD